MVGSQLTIILNWVTVPALTFLGGPGAIDKIIQLVHDILNLSVKHAVRALTACASAQTRHQNHYSHGAKGQSLGI